MGLSDDYVKYGPEHMRKLEDMISKMGIEGTRFFLEGIEKSKIEFPPSLVERMRNKIKDAEETVSDE